MILTINTDFSKKNQSLKLYWKESAHPPFLLRKRDCEALWHVHGSPLLLMGHCHRRSPAHPGNNDPSLFPCDLGYSIPKVLHMVQTDGSDHTGCRIFHWLWWHPACLPGRSPKSHNPPQPLRKITMPIRNSISK